MNVCHQLQLQKKLINRFKMNLKSVDFGLQNDPFIPFWADLEFKWLLSPNLQKIKRKL